MSAIDEMVRIVQQSGDEIIEQQVKQFNNKIKKYAQKFLDVITKDKQALEQFSENLKRQQLTVKQIQKASTDSTFEWRTQIENRKMMLKRDYYRQMIQAALTFQNQLNQLLGQIVQLVYVYQDDRGNPVLYSLDQNSLKSALIYQSNKGKIMGRFRENENFKSYLTELSNYDLSDEFNIDFFNYTYKQTIWRFNYGHKKKTDLIMWLNPSSKPKWLKAHVDQTGDIKQAYASVVLDRKINQKKIFNNQKLDTNVHDFMEEIAKVDNESGLLKGDVTVGRIQYAVKGIKAQTLGLQQIINVAQQIMNQANYAKLKKISIKKRIVEIIYRKWKKMF